MPILCSYPTIRFKASASSLNTFTSARSMGRTSPLLAFWLTFALPSGDFGPVDFSHGFQRRTNSPIKRRCSGVR